MRKTQKQNARSKYKPLITAFACHETQSAKEAESNTPASINLSACKIWLEITEDNVSYAVNAEKEIEKINTTYVTKE